MNSLFGMHVRVGEFTLFESRDGMGKQPMTEELLSKVVFARLNQAARSLARRGIVSRARRNDGLIANVLTRKPFPSR